MIYREFSKVDGKGKHYYTIRQSNYSSDFSWGIEGLKVGGGSRMVYDSEEETRASVEKKILELKKKNYTEVPFDFENVVQPDPTQNVVEVFRSRISVLGEVVEDYQPFKNHSDLFCFDKAYLPFIKYLVCSEDLKKGIVFSFNKKGVDTQLQAFFLDFVYANRHEFMLVDGFKKIAMEKPINGMTHCIVVAPIFANREPHAFPLIAESITSVYPIFNCEFPDDSSKLKIADYQNIWIRSPRPVPVCSLRFEIKNKESNKIFECMDVRNLKSTLSTVDKKGEIGAKIEVVNFQDTLIEITKHDQFVLKHGTTSVSLPLNEVFDYVLQFLMGEKK